MTSPFGRAMAGIGKAVRYEHNLRVFICVSIYVVLFGILSGLEFWAWMACLMCIGMVMCAELLNTAVERLCDLVCPEHNGLIRLIKDTSAGGVLMAVTFSAVVGSVVFFRGVTLEKLWVLTLLHPWLPVVPVVLLVPCVFFIRGSRKSVKERPWQLKNQD